MLNVWPMIHPSGATQILLCLVIPQAMVIASLYGNHKLHGKIKNLLNPFTISDELLHLNPKAYMKFCLICRTIILLKISILHSFIWSAQLGPWFISFSRHCGYIHLLLLGFTYFIIQYLSLLCKLTFAI